MLHTFIVYVENKPGVLSRVVSLFRRRAFNIDSLTVGRTEKPEVSRMTIVVDADADQARRIVAQFRATHDLWAGDPAFRALLDRLRNRLAGHVRSVIPEGPLARVELDCGVPLVAVVTAQSVAEMRLQPGDAVSAIVKTTSVHVAPWSESDSAAK